MMEEMIFTIFAIYLSILLCSCCYRENREHNQDQVNYIQYQYDYDSGNDMIDDYSGDDMFDGGFGSD